MCDLDHGTCTDSSLVLYASTTGNATSTCTQTTPCTLDHAIAIADSTRFLIRLAQGAYVGSETVTGKQITIEGTGSTLTAAPANAAAIQVAAGATVNVIGLGFSALTATPAISCDGGTAARTLSLTRVAIDAFGTAVSVNPCTATISRSRISVQKLTVPSILVVTNGTLTINRSTIDGGDGIQALTSTAIVQVQDSIFLNQQGADGALNGGTGRIAVSFSTFVNSEIKCASGAATCSSGQCVSDSIIVGMNGQDAVSGTACSISDTIVIPQTATISGTNNHLNVDPLFTNAAANDFSLTSLSPAIDGAPANAMFPATDYAGTARPQGPRADLGAYEYKP